MIETYAKLRGLQTPPNVHLKQRIETTRHSHASTVAFLLARISNRELKRSKDSRLC